MSDPVIIAAILSIAAVLISKYRYSQPPNYFHRRVMAEGELQHAREASGPNPQTVLEMVLYPSNGRFPVNGNDAKQE